jgi:hypothetical protein
MNPIYSYEAALHHAQQQLQAAGWKHQHHQQQPPVEPKGDPPFHKMQQKGQILLLKLFIYMRLQYITGSSSSCKQQGTAAAGAT